MEHQKLDWVLDLNGVKFDFVKGNLTKLYQRNKIKLFFIRKKRKECSHLQD